MTATAEPSQRTDAEPTIVLVHGAFADASSWNGVIERLQHQGYSVVAPANPLRGLAADSAYLASVVNKLDGPVLLVGHSYGGAVITNTATDAPNVVGLVFVAAFAPDTDERLGDVAATSKDSLLGTAQVQREYPAGPGGRRRPSSWSIPRASGRSSPPTCRRSRPRSWPPPSAPSPPRRSAMYPDHRHGNRCHRGRWSPPATRPSASTRSGRVRGRPGPGRGTRMPSSTGWNCGESPAGRR